MRAEARRFAYTSALLASSLLASASGQAHEGDHRHMPHMVTAGVAPLHFGHFRGGRSPGIDAIGIGAVGVAASYGFAPVRELELRARFFYLKPFAGSSLVDEGLHQFRGTLGPVLVTELIPYRLEVIALVELGAAVHRLEMEATEHAGGLTVAAGVGVRGWITWHTGFWAELRAGVADTRRGHFELWSAWPAELLLGWADRF